MAVSGKNKSPKPRSFVLPDSLKESYIITTSRRQVGIYGERFVDVLVQATKQEITGRFSGGIISVERNQDGSRTLTFSMKRLLSSDLDHNYDDAENAMRKLESTFFESREDGVWKSRSLITDPDIDEVNHVGRFRVPVEMWEAVQDYTEGHRLFRPDVAYKLSSDYAYRLYKLVCNQKIPLTYPIDEVKRMLGIEGKFKKISDFVSRVLEPAKEQLMRSADWYFEYSFDVSQKRKLEVRRGRPAYDLVVFYAKFNAAVADIVSSANEHAHGDPVSILPDKLLDHLKTRYLFSDKEIRNSHILIQAYEVMKKNNADLYGLLVDNQDRIDGSRDSGDRKAFLLGFVKQHVLKEYHVALGNAQKAELLIFQDKSGSRSRGGSPTPIGELLKKQ